MACLINLFVPNGDGSGRRFTVAYPDPSEVGAEVAAVGGDVDDARQAGEVALADALRAAGIDPDRYHGEILGSGDRAVGGFYGV